MSVRSLLCGITVLAAAAAGAQTPPVSGSFISTLGVDTIAAERYTRTGDKVEGDLLLRYPRVRVVHYATDVAGGRVKGISVTTRSPNEDHPSHALFSIVQPVPHP